MGTFPRNQQTRYPDEQLGFLGTLYIPHGLSYIPKDNREKSFLSDYQKRSLLLVSNRCHEHQKYEQGGFDMDQYDDSRLHEFRQLRSDIREDYGDVPLRPQFGRLAGKKAPRIFFIFFLPGDTFVLSFIAESLARSFAAKEVGGIPETSRNGQRKGYSLQYG